MVRRGFGYVFVGVGVLVGLGIALNIGDGHALSAYVIALLFGVALPVGVGVSLLRGGASARQLVASNQAWESELLRLAEHRGGHLTIAEVVAYADLSRDEAERYLERFCALGLAEHRIADGGVMVYRFEGFLSDADKRRAQGVFDD